MRKISANHVLISGELLPDIVVSVDDKGVVVAVERVENLDGIAGVEFYSGILMPGMVNAHCHLELSHLRGVIPAGGGFAAFVEGMKIAPREDTQGAAEFWDAKMYSEGIQAVGDICNGAATFGLKQKSSIRYHSFVEIFGAAANPLRGRELLNEARSMGLSASLTPHSLYSLSPEKFEAAVASGEAAPLSIHFLESDFEPENSAELLVKQTPKDRPVLLVHNCLATQRDIDIVMEYFAAPVTWVVCPGSNRYISGLTPPIDLLRKNRLNIAIGTDSAASNTTLSMMHETCLLQGVSTAEALTWATLGGARALGMETALGSIEKGKSPGLVAVSGDKARRIL